MTSYQTSTLVLTDPENKYRGEIFINEEEKENKGSLIILLEIESDKKETMDLISGFLQIAYGAYKQSIGNNQEKILEDILHQLNQNLIGIPQKERSWHEKINAAVGLIFENTLTFTTVGNVNAFLVKPLQFTDLVKEKITSQGPQNIFTTIISGNLNLDEAFLLTTPSLFDYLSAEKIKKFISLLPPESAMENFKNLLTNVSPLVSFLAIIIKQRLLSSGRVQSKIITTPSPSQNRMTAAEQSINNLLNKQKETAKIISTPSLAQTIYGKIKNLFTRLKSPEKSTNYFKAGITFLVAKILAFLKIVGRLIFNFLQIIVNLLAAKSRREQTLIKFNEKFVATIDYLKNLNKPKKIALIIVLLCLLFLSQNLLFSARRKNTAEAEKNYTANLNQIKTDQDTIEASLIYNDETRARQTLNDLIGILNSLPKTTPEKIAKYNDLKKAADILIERVWKLVNIQEPLALVTLNLTADQPLPKILNIANNQVQILSSNKFWQTPLKQISLTTDDLAVAHDFGDRIGAINNGTLIYANDNKLFNWTGKDLKELAIQYAPTFKGITGAGLYRNSLYLLDKNANQIYKHNPTGENYGPGQPWIKEVSFSLNGTAGLAIDGNVYVLGQNGQIQKYLSGKLQSFPQIDIYPALINPTKIFTDQNTTNLYLLDPQNKRVVILAKDGKLVKQYTSAKFDNLTNFLVQEKDKKIYLLNGDKVYLIGL